MDPEWFTKRLEELDEREAIINKRISNGENALDAAFVISDAALNDFDQVKLQAERDRTEVAQLRNVRCYPP